MLSKSEKYQLIYEIKNDSDAQIKHDQVLSKYLKKLKRGFTNIDINPLFKSSWSNSMFGNKQIFSGFMVHEYEDQINTVYGDGEKSVSSCITVNFEDNTNWRMVSIEYPKSCCSIHILNFSPLI